MIMYHIATSNPTPHKAGKIIQILTLITPLKRSDLYITMPICYVVVTYQTVSELFPEPQVLRVFSDQLKARRFVENYPTEPNQHIITYTSWLDDERSTNPTLGFNTGGLCQLDRIS
jgi:hypothetical protein